MRKIATVLVALMLVPVLAMAGSVLPDYEKEAKLIMTSICDKGDTTIFVYTAKNYNIYVGTAKSGQSFYNWGMAGDRRFAMKESASAEAKELTETEILEKMKVATSNWFLKVSLMRDSDCQRTN